MPRIILASQSPRRRQLLGQLGLEDFTILVPDVDESYDPALSPEEIVSSICRRKARAMLRSLSGREHQVCTGVTVCRGDRADTRCESTAVHFRPLTDREIESYIDTGEPMDKAGAYGIQGLGALFVESIRGDYCNVMGLPLFLLGRMLSDFGVDLLGGGEEP